MESKLEFKLTHSLQNVDDYILHLQNTIHFYLAFRKNVSFYLLLLFFIFKLFLKRTFPVNTSSNFTIYNNFMRFLFSLTLIYFYISERFVMFLFDITRRFKISICKAGH